MNINDTCDYIIFRLKEANCGLNLLKLQKLLYYCQAWHLAIHNKPLFVGKFQAWVHGPVNREIYDRFLATKTLYSEMTKNDVRPEFNAENVEDQDREYIEDVLEAYANFRSSQLEALTHQEQPWVEARRGYKPNERCERELSEETMRTYYAARLQTSGNQAS
jgi:uncharacterized phage-associated protein